MMSEFRIFPNCSTILLLLLLLTLFSLDLSGQETDIDANAKKSSLVNSVVLNAEGMLQGDLLVYENRFYDGKFFKDVSQREIMQIDAIHRIIFDHEHQKHIVLSRINYDHLDLKKITPQFDGRVVRSIESGIVLDILNKKGIQKLQDRSVQVQFDGQPSPMEMVLDPRTIGMMMGGFGPFEQLKIQLAQLATGDSLASHRVLKNSTELSFRVGMPTEGNIENFWDIEFCNETNMPIKFSDYSRFPSGNTDQPHVTCYRWKEMGNLHIPVYYSCAAVRGYFNLDSLEKTFGDMKSECTLHWFVLNEPIPNRMFEKENLFDAKRFNELIDPKRNNADTIVKAMEKRVGMAESGSSDSDGAKQNQPKR